MFSRTSALNTWRNFWYNTCYPARVGSFSCVLAFKMETRVLSIRTWLSGIDSSLLKYQDDFEKLDFINGNCVNFLCQSDFTKFEVYPSDLHQRMILNAVAKLQTPNSKKGLEHVQETRWLAPQKLYDESNSTDFGWDVVALVRHGVISSINAVRV